MSMSHISEVLNGLAHIDVGVKCAKCGAIPQLTGKQYTVKCERCGTFITLSPSFLAAIKEKEYEALEGKRFTWHKCGLCKDRGFIRLEEQNDTQLVEYFYKCLCAAGQNLNCVSAWPVVPIEKAARDYKPQPPAGW